MIEVIYDSFDVWLLLCHDWVLFDNAHCLNHYTQFLSFVLGIETNFQGMVLMLRKAVSDVIKYNSHHFRNTDESDVKVELISHDPEGHLFELHILVSINFFSVMVSDKGSIHPPDLNLHDIFQKSTTNQIEILPFKTFQLAPFRMDFIVKILFEIFNIISDWSTGSRLYFEYEWLPFLVIAHAIDLGT